MSDLISREDVKDLILEIDPFWAEGTTRAIFDGVNEIRAVSCVETIVRCKDCKWWGDLDPKNRYTDCYCHVVECSTEPDWYCADGERKADATD